MRKIAVVEQRMMSSSQKRDYCPILLCKSYGGPIHIISSICSRNNYDQTNIKRLNGIQYIARTAKEYKRYMNMAATLALACKELVVVEGRSIQHEMLYYRHSYNHVSSSTSSITGSTSGSSSRQHNILSIMMDFILSQTVSKTKTIDFIAMCFMNCIVSMIHQLEEILFQDSKEYSAAVIDIHFFKYVVNGLITILTHHFDSAKNEEGSKELFHDSYTTCHVVIRNGKQDSFQYHLIQVVLSALRSFFNFLIQKDCSKETITKFIHDVQLNNLVHVILIIIKRDGVNGNNIYYKDETFGLLGDIFTLTRFNDSLKNEEIIFKICFDEKVLTTLIRLQYITWKGVKKERDVTISKLISFIIQTILHSQSVVSSSHHRPYVEPIIRAAICALEEGNTSWDGSNVYHMQQWSGIYACLFKMSVKNDKNSRKTTIRKKRKRSMFEKELMKTIMRQNLLSSFIWSLLHQDKIIQGNGEVIINCLCCNVSMYSELKMMSCLLNTGFVHSVVGVKEKCRLLGRDGAVKCFKKILIRMQSGILFQIQKFKEVLEDCEEASLVNLFHLVADEMKLSKVLAVRELMLLCLEFDEKQSSLLTTMSWIKKLQPVMFSFDNQEKIFICLKGYAQMLRFTALKSYIIKENPERFQLYHQSNKNHLYEKIVVARTFCIDKGVHVMMKCANLKTLMKNAHILANMVNSYDGF